MKTLSNDDVMVYIEFAINKDDQSVIRMTCMNSGIDFILNMCHTKRVTFTLTETQIFTGELKSQSVALFLFDCMIKNMLQVS